MADVLVLDTAALIGWPLQQLAGGLVVAAQEEELQRISPDRGAILNSLGVIFSEPSAESLEQAGAAAKETGDMAGLSNIDLALLALSLERSATLVTDDYRMQNIAAALGIEWNPIAAVGIVENWRWALKCVGCGATQSPPEQPSRRRGEHGNCPNCGTELRLRRVH